MRTDKTTKMANTNDANTLSSGTPQEKLYADYANALKSMANTARKAAISTPKLKYSPEAKKAYAGEVETLGAKLKLSMLNAPKERQAQLLANSVVTSKTKSNGDIEPEQLKKIKQQALSSARAKFGAKREPIEISDKEWEAIQKGAVTENVLSKILVYADADVLRQKATPRETKSLSTAKLNKLQNMKLSGYTNQEIAEALNISASTVANYL